MSSTVLRMADAVSTRHAGANNSYSGKNTSLKKIPAKTVASTTSWYKGSQPTVRETIAATYKASQKYPEKQKELFSALEREMATPGSYMYMPYNQPTTTKYTQTNVNNTNKALAELGNLQNELSFWATSSRNYSDDEIIGRIDWGKYPTLSKMNAGFEGGEPLALLAPVGYSKDAMYGMMWAARNPTMSSGDPFLDSVQSAYGKGKAYKRDEQKAAWLDPTHPDYNPYAVGSTMDDMMLKYRTETFDDKWLAEHRDLLLDPDTAKDYTKIWHANEKTKKLQAEAADWDAYVQAAMRLGTEPSKIFTEDALEEYSGLYDLYLSQKSGGIMDTTAAINFDWASQQQAAEAEYMRVHGTASTPEYETQLNNGTGGSHVQNQTDSELEKRWLLNTGIIGKYPMTPGEERSFRARAYSGYNDVVFTAADGVANGTGGKEQMNLALAGEANALASKYWFNAMDTISGVENKQLSDYMSIEAYDRLKALFPNMESELPTEDEFLHKWKNASAVYEPDQLMSEFDMKGEDNVTLDSVKGTKLGAFMATYAPGKETFTREDVQDAFGQYAQTASAPVPWEMLGEELAMARVAKEQDAADLEAAKAQLAEIEDAVAEAWGEDTEQYRAFFGTYEYVQQEENSRWNNYTDYDQYQRYTMQEGYDPAKGTEYLVAARGSAAQDVKRARAALENAQKLGFDQKMIEKLELHLREKENRLSLLNAHYLSANADYSEKVGAFDKSYTPENIDWFDGNDVLNAITDPDEALNIAYGSAVGNDNRLSGLRDAVYLVSAMTDEEKSNYKYKYAKEGAESASAYFDALSEILTVRKSKQVSEATQEWAGENAATGAIATAGSIAMSPLEALEGVTNTIRALFGEELNPYKDYSVSRTKSDLRTGVENSIKEFVEDPMLEAALVALFEAGTSAGDSLVSSVTGGAAAMAFSAMNSSMMEASMRGASREQALWYGFWNAAIEMGTEKLGMERIAKAFQKKGAGGIRELIGEMSSGFINELGEETAGGFAQKMTDDIIMGALSNYNALVAEYESIGLTRAEAEAQAAKDTLVDIGYQGVIGGLSGSMSSAGGFVAGAVLGKENAAEGSEKPVEAPVEPVPPVYQGTEKERAVTALATAQGEGVGEVQQQATVQGVLEGLGVSAQESSAAAKAIIDSAGTKIARLLIAKSDNASEMAKAIAMAEVNPRSRSHAVMMQKVDSRNARALGKQLVEAYHADIENRQTVAQYEAAVAESATNDATIEAEKATDMGEIEKARQAKQLLGKETRARWNAFAKAQKEVESASAALKEASAAVAQSPTKEAIDMQRRANKELQKVRSERDSAKSAFEETNARYKEAAATEQKLVQNVQSTARAQAKQQVIVETEQRKVAQAEAQQKAAKEAAVADVKRQVDNTTSLEADEFVETYMPDAPEEVKEQTRRQYMAYDGETKFETFDMQRFVNQISRKFGVKISFTDSHGIFEGANLGAKGIVLDVNATQDEVIHRVLVHEIIHSAETSQSYGALSTAVLEVFYNGDTDRMDADLKAIGERYAKQTGQKGDKVARSELVAVRLSEMISGNQEALNRLVQEKPNVAQRIWQAVKDFVNKMRGVTSPEMDAVLQLEKMLEGALGSRNDSKTENKFVFEGYTKDGMRVYSSNFPEGSTKETRSSRILQLIQDVWSKNPIELEIERNGKKETIIAQFDPYVSDNEKVYSDATKLAAGNRKGNASDRKTSQKLADDIPDIISRSKYDHSKDETGGKNEAHDGVTVWHYFTNEIGFINEDGTYADYDISVDVKEKADGDFVYAFAARRKKGSERTEAPDLFSDPETLNAPVSGMKPTIAKDIISGEDGNVNSKFSLRDNKQTETETFKRWFGSSKVVNEDGSPKVLYHGTDAYKEIEVFKKGKRGYLGPGIYLTDSKSIAESYANKSGYGGKTYEMYASIQNPLYITDLSDPGRELLEAAYGKKGVYEKRLEKQSNATFLITSADIKKLQAKGYDGIIWKGEKSKDAEYMVFDPTQIKSATDNVGTFDPQNPNVKFSLPSQDILNQQIAAHRAELASGEPWEARQKKSQFAEKTGQDTNVLSNETKQKLLADPYYTTTSEKKNLAIAVDHIAKDGYSKRRDMMINGDTNMSTPAGQVEAYVLMKLAKESGDAEAEAALAFKAKESGTQIAQSLAMRRLYVQMSPEGKLEYVQKAVNRINANYEANGKDTRVEVPSWLKQALIDADGDNAKSEQALDDAYREIALQMPYSFKDWESTWRYLAMLGNPLSHVKNLLGVAAYTPYVATRNKVSALLQKRKPQEERTRTLGPIKKEYLDFAKVIAATQQKAMKGETATTSRNAMAKIEEYRQKGPKWMDKLSTFNSEAMATEDLFWKNKFFTRSLASYLQAKGADLNDLSPEMLNGAIQHALDDAYRNTFNNVNQLARAISNAERALESSGTGGKVLSYGLKSILPFKNTPANVLARGVDFSPVGLTRALTFDLHKYKQGKMTADEYFDKLSAGLTGFGATALGFALASMGFLNMDEDELTGEQENSITLLGVNIGIDWMGTAAMPVLMGGRLYQMWEEQGKEIFDDGFDLSDVPNLITLFGEAMRGVTDPMINLSMLQGVNNFVKSAGYAGDNAISALGTRAATTYASQFVPSFFGAVARIVDETRRTTYTDKNSVLPSDIQYFGQSIINKIPVLSWQGMPYMDAWGNDESNGPWWRRMLNNLLLPGYSRSIESPDEVEKMLADLYDTATAQNISGASDAKLKAAEKSFSVNGETYHMTAEEYEKMSKVRGQTAYDLLQQLMQQEEFYNGSDYYKVKAVGYVWDYANTVAKREINADYAPDVYKWVLTTKDPFASIMEKAASQTKEYENGQLRLALYDAIRDGRSDEIQMYQEALIENGVKEDSLKKSITNELKAEYLTMYSEDQDAALGLEYALRETGLFKTKDFNKWMKED